ncbi:MAG: TolC family protein, partial [Pseudomonadota bacterium]
VTRVELEVAAAARAHTDALAGLQTARLELGYLINVAPLPQLRTPTDLLAAAAAIWTPPAESTVLASALEHRLDLGALRSRQLAARAYAEEPKLRWLPRLGLSGQMVLAAGTSGRADGLDGLVAITLGWSLFDGAQRQAERREREALLAIADLELQARSRQVVLEVRRSLVSLTAAQISLEQSRAAAAAAKRNAEETSALYQQGLARAIEVTDAGLGLFEAEVEMAKAEYRIALAFLELHAAFGQDLQSFMATAKR